MTGQVSIAKSAKIVGRHLWMGPNIIDREHWINWWVSAETRSVQYSVPSASPTFWVSGRNIEAWHLDKLIWHMPWHMKQKCNWIVQIFCIIVCVRNITETALSAAIRTITPLSQTRSEKCFSSLFQNLKNVKNDPCIFTTSIIFLNRDWEVCWESPFWKFCLNFLPSHRSLALVGWRSRIFSEYFAQMHCWVIRTNCLWSRGWR